MEIVLGLVVVIGLVIAGVAVAARRIQADHLATNQVIPGVSTNAPDSWAGSHTREARLHRRIRDAMVAVVEHPLRDDPTFAPARRDLEDQAIAVDERLIALSRAPAGTVDDAFAAIEQAVDGIEQAVGKLVASSGEQISADTAASISERIDYVAQARAELDRLYPTDPSAEAYEQRMRRMTDDLAESLDDEGEGRSQPG